MKLTASDAHAEADPVPKLCQLDFCQQLSRVIQDSLMGHTDTSREHGIRKPKRPESANAIPGDVQAGAARWPRHRTLDDSGTTACSRSARLSARPAIPPPTIRMRSDGIRVPTRFYG
jgi:hypothetical protein